MESSENSSSEDSIHSNIEEDADISRASDFQIDDNNDRDHNSVDQSLMEMAPLQTEESLAHHDQENDPLHMVQKDKNNNQLITLSDDYNVMTLKSEKDSSNKRLSETFLKYSDKPQQFGKPRTFIVMNLFNDMYRWLGFGTPQPPPKRYNIQFPDEIISMAEEKGETAGKDRFVPLKEQPYRRPERTRKIIQPYNDMKFTPRLRAEDPISKCERRFEKWLLNCSCFKQKRHSAEKKTFKLSHLAEGVMYDTHEARKYIYGHETLTFPCALECVDFPVEYEAAVGVIGIDTESMNSIADLDTKIIPLSKSEIGQLATNIWIFTYSIPLLFDSPNDELLPTEQGFWRLLEQFAALATSVNEECTKLIQRSQNFYNYATECNRVIELLQNIIEFEGVVPCSPALKRGDGLKLVKGLNKAKIHTKPAIQIMVSRKNEDQIDGVFDTLDWIDFKNLSGHDKVSSLIHLLHVTVEGFSHAQGQLRLLLDDIIDTARDKTVFDSDILYLLDDIFSRINRLASQVQSEKRDKEIALIEYHLEIFTKAFGSFIETGQHIMQRIMEFHDMVYLSCLYFRDELKMDLLKFLPVQVFQEWGLERQCCCWKSCCTKSSKGYVLPEYNKLDFYRVYYEEALSCSCILADNFNFQLREREDKQFNIALDKSQELKFSRSDPTHIFRSSVNSNRSGSLDIFSPKASEIILPESILKPILKKDESVEMVEGSESGDIHMESVMKVSSYSAVDPQKDVQEPKNVTSPGPHKRSFEEDHHDHTDSHGKNTARNSES